MTATIVVVGNGVAGTEAAIEARRLAPKARIHVISEETDRFFARTALMYVAAGQMEPRDLFPIEEARWKGLDVLSHRTRVVALDLEARRLDAVHGSWTYDALVLAPGSRPRRPDWPGLDLLGVGHLVTWQDLVWFTHEVAGRRVADPATGLEGRSPYTPRVTRRERFGAPRAPTVVGGGLIGIEAIEVLLAAGHHPRFVLRDHSFWPMALDPREQEIVVGRLQGHGVEVLREARVHRLVGDGRVEAIETDQGTWATDLVVVAVGVEPHTACLTGSGLHLADGAIVVDAHLAAGPSVWGAGDAVAVDLGAGPQRWPLWYAARDMGRVAGIQAGGGQARYAPGTPYNAARLMDLEYLTAGTMQGDTTWFDEETGAVRSTLRLALRDGRLVGMTSLGRRWDLSIWRQWIAEGRRLNDVLDGLSTARFDTEFVPPYVPGRR